MKNAFFCQKQAHTNPNCPANYECKDEKGRHIMLLDQSANFFHGFDLLRFARQMWCGEMQNIC
jgi:hypothetical protein